MRRSNYEIVFEDEEKMVLRDIGPWDHFLTITNDAENVVLELRGVLRGRRLFYYDSEGELTEIDVRMALGGQFL